MTEYSDTITSYSVVFGRGRRWIVEEVTIKDRTDQSLSPIGLYDLDQAREVAIKLNDLMVSWPDELDHFLVRYQLHDDDPWRIIKGQDNLKEDQVTLGPFAIEEGEQIQKYLNRLMRLR